MSEITIVSCDGKGCLRQEDKSSWRFDQYWITVEIKTREDCSGRPAIIELHYCAECQRSVLSEMGFTKDLKRKKGWKPLKPQIADELEEVGDQ